jgi:hypothetical protein
LRRNLFHERHYSQRRHPPRIHDTDGERSRHQGPAAADAEQPVVKTHAQRTGRTVDPPLQEIAERRAAMRQASAFERCELIEPGDDEDDRTHPRDDDVAGWLHQGRRLERALQERRTNRVAEPCQ